jgi:hypothetical protein
MPAPNSPVAICNIALDHLKQKQITSITPPTTTPETICARHYDQTRRAVLESHPWNFAIKRVQLTPLASAPAFGYSYAYALPPDFIRLLTIGDDAGGQITPTALYQLEGFQLLTGSEFSVDSSGTQNLRYIFDATNVNQFPPLFIEILAIELALNMAYAFTGLGNRVVQLRDLLKDKAPRGYSIDGQQRPPIRIQRSRFVRARRITRGNVAGPNTIIP